MKRDLSKCFIELYAGAGGSVLGQLQAGLKCIAAVERDPSACASFWRNLCMAGWSNFKIEYNEQAEKIMKALEGRQQTINWLFDDIPRPGWCTDETISPVLNLYCCDIEHMTPEWLMEELKIAPGEIGFISGGPPCQGFSLSNSKRHEHDERNQHPLLFINFINKVQPKLFHMENVPGLLTMAKGKFVKWIYQAATEAGYVISHTILNAANFGVPQTRRRVFFQGIRQDLYDKGMRHRWPEPTHNWNFHDVKDDPEKLAFHLNSGLEPFVNVQEAIGDLGGWQLSSSRDKDVRHLPDGHKDRRANTGVAADHIVRKDGYIYYRDRFTGNYFKGNHCSDLGTTSLENYCTCLWCRKLNLYVRKKCHYCGNFL